MVARFWGALVPPRGVAMPLHEVCATCESFIVVVPLVVQLDAATQFVRLHSDTYKSRSVASSPYLLIAYPTHIC